MTFLGTPSGIEIPREDKETIRADEKPSYSERFLDIVNIERTEAGFLPVSQSPILEGVALKRAVQLVESGILSHYNEAGEVVFDKLLTEAGAPSQDFYIEILAYSHNRTDVALEDIYSLFYGSCPHRSTIFWSTATQIGVGAERAKDGGLYLAAIFQGYYDSTTIQEKCPKDANESL